MLCVYGFLFLCYKSESAASQNGIPFMYYIIRKRYGDWGSEAKCAILLHNLWKYYEVSFAKVVFYDGVSDNTPSQFRKISLQKGICRDFLGFCFNEHSYRKEQEDECFCFHDVLGLINICDKYAQ